MHIIFTYIYYAFYLFTQWRGLYEMYTIICALEMGCENVIVVVLECDSMGHD